MANGRRKRGRISAQRKAARQEDERREVNELAERQRVPADAVMVDREALAPSNSYGEPEFLQRGYYVDTPFQCVDCGKDEVWTAAQQKWWYEVAKGFAYSFAKRCRPCRHKRRDAKQQPPSPKRVR
jgi:hypothetical protein